LGAAALSAVCVAALSIGEPVAAGPGSPRETGVVGDPIAWADCGERLECGRVRVPLDWDRPAGPTIRLSVIRHLASRPEERIGSMFVNPGGPGESGVGLVRGDPEGLDAWGGGRFDVVVKAEAALVSKRHFESPPNVPAPVVPHSLKKEGPPTPRSRGTKRVHRDAIRRVKPDQAAVRNSPICRPFMPDRTRPLPAQVPPKE
jgi:hypothetical protein